MRVNDFYEKENRKKLCFLISACSRIEENESLMSFFVENITLDNITFT